MNKWLKLLTSILTYLLRSPRSSGVQYVFCVSGRPFFYQVSMKINDQGLKLIKDFEGLRLKSYLCPAKVWTVGFGATGKGIVPGLEWTEEQAEERLKKDVAAFEKGVTELVKVKLTSNQFSALVCFTYNVGLGAFKKSTLLRLLNKGDTAGAAEQLLRWNKANGQVLKGLTRRREAEKALFLA